MVEVVPFKKEHMLELLKEPHNQWLGTAISEAQMEATEKTGMAQTVLRKSTGKVLCVGGVTEYWPGRGECWCTFTKDCKEEFVLIHRVALRLFESVPVRRIEASVAINFNEGHRWIKALGFTLDAPLLKAYLPGGGDVALYSKVKE